MNLKQLFAIFIIFLIRLVLTSHQEQAISNIEKEKRISDLVLISIHTFAIGTNMFQSLDKCRTITPSFNGNKAKLKTLMEKLIQKRRKVNFIWGKVVTKARFIQRLKSSIQILNIQLKEIDTLMADTNNQQQRKKDLSTADRNSQQQYKRDAVPIKLDLWERIRGALSKVVLSAKTVNAFVVSVFYAKTCAEKANKLENGLKTVEIAYEKIKGLESEAKLALKYEDLVYENVYSDAISPKIILKLEKLNIEVLKSPIFNQNIGNMSYAKNMSYFIHIANYLSNFTANESSPNQRDKIIRNCISVTLPFIIKKLRCSKELFNAEKRIILKCSDGLDTFKNLYDKAKESIKTCNKSSMSNFDTVKNQVKEKLSLQGKTIICLRNNNVKQKLVCTLRNIGDSKESIVKKMNLSYSEYNYYLSFCDKYIDIPHNGEVSICYKKTQMVTVQQVKTDFPLWNPIQVADAYDKCKITKQMKNVICNEKHNSIKLNSIQKTFYVYPEEKIRKVFMKCPLLKVIRKFDRIFICFYQKKRVKYHSKPMKIYRTRYDESVLIEFWTSCRYKKVTLPSQKIKICNAKANEMDIYEVLNLYKNWYPKQVREIYNKCALSDKQIAEICKLKEIYNELEIIQKFHLYDKLHVIDYYKKCLYFSLAEKYKFCLARQYSNFDFLVQAMTKKYHINDNAINSLCKSVLSTCFNAIGELKCKSFTRVSRNPFLSKKSMVIEKQVKRNRKFQNSISRYQLMVMSNCYKKEVCLHPSLCNDRYGTRFCYLNAHQCYQPDKYQFMKRNCHKTCYCEKIQAKDCVDIAGNYCNVNKHYCYDDDSMVSTCYKTCVCDPREKNRAEYLPDTEEELD